MSFLHSLTSIGTNYSDNRSERRSIYLSNILSIIIATTGFTLWVIYFVWYGANVVTTIIPIIAGLSLVPLLLNYLEFSKASRMWISLFIPVSTMALSIYSKIVYYEQLEELDYFTFRIIILSCCIFPPIFFSIREKVMLITCSLGILMVLMLHDPLHNLFDVPYRPMSISKSNYTFTNIVIFFMYLVMTGGVLFMKFISELNEEKAQKLIEDLNISNQKLSDKNREIEFQNQEILNQTHHLDISRKKLTDAYKIIEEQRNLLFVQNKNLSTELIEKNQELTETNNELIKHNNELRQFSYTVSHNLRGPVASLMGLLKLFNRHQLEDDNRDIFGHIETSTLRLDNIIKDLSKIIDIRNDIFQIRQQIDLSTELKEILQGLNREIISHNITVIQNLAGNGIIYSVRPMVHSILYNLITNAIKYRSTERNSIIEITTHEDGKYYFIEVRDNGLGIDIGRDRDNLFKLYKRFHHHTEGKGLGLYLVKLQAEALGGSISVTSELNKFTHFSVRLKKPENANRQILLAEETSEIFFDATVNCIGIVWKKSTADPITVLRKIIEFIKVYNTPNYIADLSATPISHLPASEILFTYIIPETAGSGLKRVAVITPANVNGEHFTNTEQLLSAYKVSLHYFTDVNNALNWIKTENELSEISK
jgi:signal transduction histidine kinase